MSAPSSERWAGTPQQGNSFPSRSGMAVAALLNQSLALAFSPFTLEILAVFKAQSRQIVP